MTGKKPIPNRDQHSEVFKNNPESALSKVTADAKFLFVRGFMRSGTNWVGNLLNLHPKVNCTGEFYFDEAKMALDKLIQGGYSLLGHPSVKKDVDGGFEEFVKTCIISACNNINTKNGIQWFGDRTPRDIEPVLVNGGRYFLVIRDPRDVMVSWAYHLLRLKLSGNPDDPHKIHFDKYPKLYEKRTVFKDDQTYYKQHPYELLSDNETWVRAIARQWHQRMQLNWNSLKKIESGKIEADVLTVKYEDLHQNIEEERRKIYHFLDLDPIEADPINEMTLPGFKKENFNSHYRKGVIGDWKSYFTTSVARWFNEEAGESLMQFGYEEREDWTEAHQ